MKLGFLVSQFADTSELNAHLAALQRLDRNRFDLHLFAFAKSGLPIEQRAMSLAGRLTVLQGTPQQQANVLRNADMDILLIGGDLISHGTLLAYIAAHPIGPRADRALFR